STVCMGAQRGMDVVVLRPEGYDLDAPILEQARELAAAAGGSLRVTDDRAAALSGAQVVYAKSWGKLAAWGDAAAEIAARAHLRDWCVDHAWMERTDGARFMHCLPVRRNVVVADEVLDGPRSVVVDQAETRLHAQTALLEEVFAAREAAADAVRSPGTPELESIR
ncbi:MAG TPA: acetylornithine carbamoyltransferase, partial [Planctomycetota bacterium]|nr:acetylornithine carbamoyltransferase [Planctomycetota bacterium]